MIKVKQIWQSSLFRASGIYTIASFTNAAIPFLLLPVLTKYLSHSDFGVVAMFITYTGFLMPLVGINMEGAIARKYYSDREHIAIYTGNCLLLSAVSFTLIIVLSFLFNDQLVHYTGIDGGWLQMGIILTLFQFIVMVALTLFQVKVKPFHYGFMQVSQSAINLGLSIALIVVFHFSWEGRLISQFSSSIICGIVALGLLLKNKDVRFSWNPVYVKHAIRFGASLIPHALGVLFIIYTMRFFLLHYVGMDQLGLFSVATQVSSILGFFTLSFNNAYVPWLYKKLDMGTEEIRRSIVKLTYLYFAVIILAGVVFCLITPLMFKMFINKTFWPAAQYTPWIIAGLVFQGMYYMVTNYISYVEKTWYQAIITIIVGLSNIPVCYFFTKKFGIQGAAFSFFISNMILFITTWTVSNRLYKMPWL